MIILTDIHWDYIISNKRNDFLFGNGYFIILHNKTILKTVDMNTILMKCGALLNI